MRDTAGLESSGLTRIIWKNSWPLLGLMLLNFLVGYTDVYVAGLLGPDVQAAVGFISQQYFVLIILGNALGVGSVALISQASGKGDWERVVDITRQTMLVASSLGALLTLAVFFGAEAILRPFNLPAPIQPIALTYLRIYAFALAPNYAIIAAAAVFRAIGKPLFAFWIMALVTALNVAAAFGLVFGLGPLPKLGYAGIAWATASAMTVGAVFVLALYRGREWRSLWKERFRISGGIVRSIAAISWPAALLQAGWHTGGLALYEFLGRMGEGSVAAMAAYSNGLRLESISFLPAFALNMAAAVLVGQSLGAGSVERARTVGRRMAIGGALILSLFAAVLFIAAPRFASMLTSDPHVWSETLRYVRINLLVAPFMVTGMVLGGAMQGAGDTRGVMTIIILAMWGIRIPLAAALAFGLDMGALGVWVAMDISMVIQAFLMVRRFSGNGWFKAHGG
ncbi:MAG: MATE family efflux transporter [Acidobacteriota bacterium]